MATISLGQSRLWSDGNEKVLDTPQISRIGAASPDGTLTATTTASQSGHGNNDCEKLLDTPQIPRTRATSPDGV